MAEVRSLWQRWWLRRYGRVLLALVGASVLASLALQWFLWHWHIRLLFGAWMLASVVVALWLVWQRRLSRGNAYVVRHRDTEALWLLQHAHEQGLSSPAARAYLAQRAQQEMQRVRPAAVPYALTLGLAVAGALLMQIRMVVAFAGWALLGPWGPHVTVSATVMDQLSASYEPPAYVREPALALVAGSGSVRLEQGGTLRVRGRRLHALGEPVARLETDLGVLVAQSQGRSSGAELEFALAVTRSGSMHLRLSVESLGLTLDQPQAMQFDVQADPKPAVQWSAIPDKTQYDEDELWQGSLTASDNHGVRWVGFHIADEQGATVTDVSDQGPERYGNYAQHSTSAAARITPGMYLGKLRSGVWTVTPIAQDWNADVSEPGYGQSVTLVVLSRFDKHEAFMDRIQELFLLALGYTADRWEGQPVPREAHKRVQEQWAALQAGSADAWSAFGLDVVERAVRRLTGAIDHPRQPALHFEAAALELMRAQELEQQSVVGDRMGDVERSQQDLMAALNDAAKSDEEIMQLVRELLQKMQKLAEASQDRNRPLPQELYNKEAFQAQNLKEQKSDLQTMLEKLQSGDRAGAMDMLKNLMGEMDKMREELQKSGAASTPSDTQGPPEVSESGQSRAGQGSGSDNAGAEQLAQVRKAKAELQKAIDEQLKALGKADGARRDLDARPGMDAGQAEGKLGDPRAQAGRAAGQLQAAQKSLEPDPSRPGGIFDREAQQVRQAAQGWQKGREQLERPKSDENRSADPVQRLSEFQREGEQSMQALRETMQSLERKEQALQQMQMSGGQSQRESRRDADFDEERQKAESNAKLRAKLFDNFGSGMPDAEKNANQQYFDKLVR